MKLIVGLGNPGKKYLDTRHNVGFAIVENFLAKEGLSLKSESKFNADMVIENFIIHSLEDPMEHESEKVVYALPNTYMNLSGQSVSKIMNFYKIKASDVLVVHDDVSLDLGRMRLTFNRGAGGQHGVEDIINRLGNNKKFYRLRIGVGPDPGGDMRADYVLGKFTNKEKKIFEEVIRSGVDAMKDWIINFGSERDEEFISEQGKVIEKYNTFAV